MSKIVLNDTTMTNIGNAIREKAGTQDKILPKDMPDAIRGIIPDGSSNGTDLEILLALYNEVATDKSLKGMVQDVVFTYRIGTAQAGRDAHTGKDEYYCDLIFNETTPTPYLPIRTINLIDQQAPDPSHGCGIGGGSSMPPFMSSGETSKVIPISQISSSVLSGYTALKQRTMRIVTVSRYGSDGKRLTQHGGLRVRVALTRNSGEENPSEQWIFLRCWAARLDWNI